MRQRRLESDAEPRCHYDRSRRAILYRHNDCAAGGPFFCAGDNPCSDSQIDPMKSRIAADFGTFRGKPCSDSQIHPMKSGIAAAVGLFPGIPCSDSQIPPMKSGITARKGAFPGNPCSDSQIDPLKSGITAALGLFSWHFLQRFPSLPPEINNHCSLRSKTRGFSAAIPKLPP